MTHMTNFSPTPQQPAAITVKSHSAALAEDQDSSNTLSTSKTSLIAVDLPHHVITEGHQLR